MKKNILLIFILFIIVDSASAEHMKITLKNNTFSISSSCVTPRQDYGKGDYKCNREYVIKLVSKYNVFENYKSANGWNGERGYGAVVLQTSFYEFKPSTYAPNKSILNIYLKESDLEKLLESDEVKINFSLTLFSDRLLQQELDNINKRREREENRNSNNSLYHIPMFNRVYDVNILEPSLVLDFSNTYLNNLKSDCSAENSQCKQKLDSLNSPMDRLKRFFN